MELNQNVSYVLTADDWWENISIYWYGSYTLIYYNKKIIFKRLKDKFVRVLNIEEDSIFKHSHLLNDLHLQGTDIVFLVCVLECEYDLRPNDKLACQIDSVEDLLYYCEQTWPGRGQDIWFPDLLLPEPEPKTKFRRVLKTINQGRYIKKVTTFIRKIFQRSPNRLRKYLTQGRRRWLKIEEQGIHPSEEIIDEKLTNWQLWTEQDLIDWYGAEWPRYKDYHKENMNLIKTQGKHEPN